MRAWRWFRSRDAEDGSGSEPPSAPGRALPEAVRDAVAPLPTRAASELPAPPAAALALCLAGQYGHLAAPLERLDRILARAVERVAAAYGAEVAADPFRGLYISQRDATQWSQNPRIAPVLGVAEDEVELVELIDETSPLAALARAYGLTSFDLELIVVALAPEIDVRYERLYAFLQDDVSRRMPSVDLTLNLSCRTADEKLARRDHLGSDAPLLQHDLIELVPDQSTSLPSLLGHFVRLDDTVIRYLLQQRGVDSRLRRVSVLLEPDSIHGHVVFDGDERQALAALVADAHAAGERLVLYFSGPRTRSKREMAYVLAGAAGAPLLAVDVDYALASEADSGRLLKVAFREALLHDAILFLEPLDQLLASELASVYGRLVDELADRPGVTVLAGTPVAPPLDGPSGVVDVAFPIPSHLDRRSLWRDRLAADGIDLPGPELDQLAGLFRLTPDQIADAVEVARNRSRLRFAERPAMPELLEAARSRSDAALVGLARKIEPIHDWDQIVLPADSMAQLREICAQVVQRHRVLDEWGFARRQSLGKGVSALFAGPSGTGKTMAADIISRELGLVLYKIDLSGVVSKYIGETEKNLERIFAAAENANAILFFDEADALFGKRSEVRDSHDRYANLEIAYLLQRMEQYDGVAILASNLRQNMDEAFVRRLQFVVEFPFPDEEHRARIWPLLFPEEAERSQDIDFEALAHQFRVTGGSIRNIVLGAAYLAASEEEPIATRHLLHATRREYVKLGRVLTAAELGPYAGQVAL
jgi:ATPase family associated with various cellular activities (AAA)